MAAAKAQVITNLEFLWGEQTTYIFKFKTTETLLSEKYVVWGHDLYQA